MALDDVVSSVNTSPERCAICQIPAYVIPKLHSGVVQSPSGLSPGVWHQRAVAIAECRFEEATHRTTRWIDRCIKAHARTHEQNLFAIVQGGLNKDLRGISIKDLSARNLPGYAIGGLAGGESKDDFWR